MRHLILLSLLVLAGVALGAAPGNNEHEANPPKKEESLRNDTAGVLVVIQDGKELGLIFVSKTGQILPENVAACEANAECATLMKRLHDTEHMTIIQLPSAKPDPLT